MNIPIRLVPIGLSPRAGDLQHHTNPSTRCRVRAPQVFLVPGDTFRAAANEQLIEWGRRAGATMGTFTEGSRPMAVIAEVSVRRAWDPGQVQWQPGQGLD